MKRKPRGITIEVGGTDENFLLSTYVSRIFSRTKGSESPDAAANMFASNPFETIIKLAELSYNNYPGNESLDEREICYLLDEMEAEEIEIPYIIKGIKKKGDLIEYLAGTSTVSKWEYLQHEILRNCFPKPRREKNLNGEAATKKVTASP